MIYSFQKSTIAFAYLVHISCNVCDVEFILLHSLQNVHTIIGWTA